MNKKSLLVLASVVAGLVLLLALIQQADHGSSDASDRLLLDGLAEQADEIRQIQLLFPDGKDGVTVHRENDRWVVSDRHNYPADIGKLGQLVSGLAEARIVEEKTSDAARYVQLGVDDPASGGSGSKVIVGGEGFFYEVILGEVAQRDYRYARVAGDARSYLVDRKLEVAEDASDWLLTDIIDLPSDLVRRVTISHADGETLTLEKTTRDETNFSVLDIPEGRELSYVSVGNGIAGALANLALEDVRPEAADTAAAIAVYETWGGLRVTVSVFKEDDTAWLAFAADAVPQAEPDLQESADPTGTGSDNESDPESEAARLNSRLAQWQYRVAEHKKNLLVRRWEDILKSR